MSLFSKICVSYPEEQKYKFFFLSVLHLLLSHFEKKNVTKSGQFCELHLWLFLLLLKHSSLNWQKGFLLKFLVWYILKFCTFNKQNIFIIQRHILWGYQQHKFNNEVRVILKNNLIFNDIIIVYIQLFLHKPGDNLYQFKQILNQKIRLMYHYLSDFMFIHGKN